MKAHLERLGKNKFVQGGAVLTISLYAASFLNYLFNSLAAKALGPDGFSEIAALFAYVNILSIPTIIITTIIVRRLGQAGDLRNAVGKEFEQWFWLNARKYMFLIPFLYILMLVLPGLTNLSTLSIFTLITLLIINLCAVIYISLFQGLHMFVEFSIATLLIVSLKFVGALGAYLHLGHLSLIYACVLLGTASPLLYGKWLLSKIKPSKKQYTFTKKVRTIIMQKNVVITAISLISLAILGNLDVIFAKKIFLSNDAGLYSAWSLFSKIILYFIGPINMISLIFFSAKETIEHRKKTMYGILGIFLVVGFTMFCTYVIFGDFLITLIFTEKYSAVDWKI